jgi:hypothetical protein
VIDAVLYDGTIASVATFMPLPEYEQDFDGALTIPTLEGPLSAQPGDWIIKGIKGEFYPCKPDIFDATYDPAEGGAP